jgi:L-gulono-1,4-lactone dehydrogenase
MPRRVFNWARTEHCAPSRIERPNDEAAVVELVCDARARGVKLKVIGARHSWSDIAMGDDVLVSLDAMQSLIEVDAARARVRTQAGVRLHALNDALAGHGLALAIVGSVVEQSLAGVISTGTHGSSVVHGNLSSLVVGLRLVTGTGEVLILDEDHPLLPAARVGLGALGIITEVTLAVVPAFRLRETTETLAFDQALAEIQTIARSAEYVKLWWLPHTDDVIVFRYDHSEEPGEIAKLWRWLDTWIINKLVFGLVLLLGRVIPALIPACNRLVAKTYLDRKPAIGRSDELLSLAMPPRHREVEYAVPLAATAEALRVNRQLIAATGVRVNFITEVRFVRGDDAWLSPASGRDSCQIGGYMAEAPGIDRYFAEFEQAMRSLDGRPHWGKEFQVTTEQLRAMYPKFDGFCETARELDPDGVFRGRFLDRSLG